MSWRHSRLAGELDLKRPPAKAVLLALAHHADEYSGQCWPSIARLVLFTGLSERSVQAAIGELTQRKLVARKTGGGKRASVYTLKIPGAEALTQAVGTPAARAPLPPQELHPSPAGGAPQSSLNTKDSPPSRAKSEVPEDWRPAELAMAQAKKEYPHVDHERELRQFIDFNRARGTEFSSIGAAWRSWLGRTKPVSEGRGRPAGDTSGRDRLRDLLDRPGKGSAHG